jgi:hypothetical protein
VPWQETSPTDERRRFIEDHARALYELTEQCARYGISRKPAISGSRALRRRAGQA